MAEEIAVLELGLDPEAVEVVAEEEEGEAILADQDKD